MDNVVHICCRRCHRPLRTAKSRALGYGPVCYRRIQAALAGVIAQYSRPQVLRAIELVDDGGIVRAGAMWIAVSSDGRTRYQVSSVAQTCTCTAGSLGRRCYHLAAATAMAA